jgi:hypothetical protein
MADINDVKRTLQKIFDAKQTVLRRWNALAGNGAGTFKVTDAPDFAWVRYLGDQSKVSKVWNPTNLVLENDTPIRIGKRFPESEYEEILEVDQTLYRWTMSEAAIQSYSQGKHGDNHNAASGTDPASIDLRNIVEMRGRPQATPDLTIHIERGQYVFGYNDIHRYPSENLDLTAEVPGVVGHRYVLVYIDGASNTAASTSSIIVPIAASPPIPDVTANTIPICIVELTNGQTTITEDNIYDWRFLWDLISWNAPWIIGTNADRLALVIGDLAELTHFAETDTDQIWQVWEGAWRIVYPPSVLAASDGDPGTPWLVGATGILTGSQNLVLDDGVTDSPQLQLVGGSNDDTARIFLDDSGIAGQSDLAITLPGNDANSVLRINDSAVAQKFALDAEGAIFQYINDAITNTFTVWQTLEHNSTGVPLTGFAGRVLYRLESGAGMTDAAALQVEWEDETSGSEDTVIRFYLRKAGAVLGDFFHLSGTETVFNTGQADIDFRIASDTLANALFLRGSDGYIGIGLAAPQYPFHIHENSGGDNYILITNNDTGTGAADGMIFGIGGADETFRFYNYEGTRTFFGGAGAGYFLILDNANGRVGIGAAVPGSLMEWNFATEDLEFVDAGSAAATEQDWIEVQIGGNTGYIHVFAAK